MTNLERPVQWVDSVVGACSVFRAERDCYVRPRIRSDFAVLAIGWEKRLLSNIYQVPNCAVEYLSPEDLAVSKLALGREKDFKLVTGMVDHGLVAMDGIRGLVSLVPGEARLTVMDSFNRLSSLVGKKSVRPVSANPLASLSCDQMSAKDSQRIPVGSFRE